MQNFIAAQANTVGYSVVNRSSGAAIVAGTVTFYLVARNGVNVGKWFRASDNSWQVAEASAGDGVHESDGHWTCEIAAEAWIAGVRYRLYAKESTDLHIAYSDEVAEITTPVSLTSEATVIQN